MSKIRRLTGAANPNFGKPWGNALGGFKNQPRVGGKFATSAQVKAAVRGGKGTTKVPKTSSSGTVNRRISPNTASVGAALAAVAVIGAARPRISVGRKRISLGVHPSRKLFGNVRAFSDVTIGVERDGDDALDRVAKRAQKSASEKFRGRVGNGTAAAIFDTAIGKSDEVIIGGKRIQVDGTPLNRRWRVDTSPRNNVSVPGAPASKGGKSTRPQGGRKGGAKTITNSTKGSAGVVRPQRRGGGKKKKKSTKSGRTYTR